MKHYHPIRADTVDKLEAARRASSKAELQAKMLQLVTSKVMSVPDLARDRTHQVRHLEEEEGFDQESSAPWRADVLEHITTARHQFMDGGRNIYDMTLISPMFINVDVDELVLDEVSLPYRAIYIHFGTGAQLSFEAERWIEGAYALEMPDETLRFTFVCNHPDFQVTDVVPLGVTYKRVTTAISTTVRKDVRIGDQISEDRFVGYPAILRSAATLTAALRMAVNGILYLNLPVPDIEFDYDSAAPADLVRVAKSDVSKAKKAKRRLEENGYIQVNFCGRNSVSAQTPSSLGGSSSSRAAHWRRGHWRRVVVGEGRTGREWRLFEPTIVNKGSVTVPLGRVHIVRPATPRPARPKHGD